MERNRSAHITYSIPWYSTRSRILRRYVVMAVMKKQLLTADQRKRNLNETAFFFFFFRGRGIRPHYMGFVSCFFLSNEMGLSIEFSIPVPKKPNAKLLCKHAYKDSRVPKKPNSKRQTSMRTCRQANMQTGKQITCPHYAIIKTCIQGFPCPQEAKLLCKHANMQ